MRLAFSSEFKKGYQKLPKHIKDKVNKQLRLLVKNFHYPSLRTRKMAGFENVWEARVTLGYRMRFSSADDTLYLLFVGSHPKSFRENLGLKEGEVARIKRVGQRLVIEPREATEYEVYGDKELEKMLEEDKLPADLAKKAAELWPDLA